MTLTHDEVDRLYLEPSVAAYRPEPVLARLQDGNAEPRFALTCLSLRRERKLIPYMRPRCNR